MDRRQFLAHSSVLAAAGLVAPKLAFGAGEAHKGLAETANDCITTGEACLQHCMESLSSGSKMMAACSVTVREMLIHCEALRKAANQKSKRLKQIAKLAAEACQDCEKECRKHEKMDVCKACADACAACAKECLSA